MLSEEDQKIGDDRIVDVKLKHVLSKYKGIVEVTCESGAVYTREMWLVTVFALWEMLGKGIPDFDFCG